jgi:hypothetical protein
LVGGGSALTAARALQAGGRKLLFFQFRSAADTQAALITLQLRLAFQWDIHLQVVQRNTMGLNGTLGCRIL